MCGNECIRINHASENNLKSVSLDIPRNKLVVVTGVSGSGKSSLVFDVLYREAEARYFGSFSSYARQFLGKMKRPEVESISGLSPVIAVAQASAAGNPRSTVGTLSGIYDMLRLLFARAGEVEMQDAGSKMQDAARPMQDAGFLNRPSGFGLRNSSHHSRSLFSFNTPEGACPVCKGLRVEDRIDPGLLVEDPTKSIRGRCMAVTTPNGYLMYSQVTLDVLEQVCRSEGFSIDIPWKDLTEEQQKVIFFGSNKIEVPFGKHPLESRMKWSGITAKPRDMGVYKGLIPVMEEILKRDRNKNILRFVRTAPCRACGGKRLNPRALSVKFNGLNIAELCDMTLSEISWFLMETLKPHHPDPQPATARSAMTSDPQPVTARSAKTSDSSEAAIDGKAQPCPDEHPASNIISGIISLVSVMQELSLGHLKTSTEAAALSPGESRRLKLATQLGSGLSGIICILDEPSAGLHISETRSLIHVLKSMRDLGNTVIVVEHEEEFIRQADHIIDIGPGPGGQGGEVLINCPVDELPMLPRETVIRSKTLSWYLGLEKSPAFSAKAQSGKEIVVRKAELPGGTRDIAFLSNALNVVTGLSGSGKAGLVHRMLCSFLRSKLETRAGTSLPFLAVEGWEGISKVIEIDQSPIGRTPRSNPATYTGLFDRIRDIFGELPESKERGYGKSRFSFNTAGGRCEECQGAGYKQTGMHFMGNVEIVCEACNGKRFDPSTLEILYHGKNIYEVLELPVSEALIFFEAEDRILPFLRKLNDLGLGYLTLGQRSSTLSGGEAQRIRIATELLANQGKKMQDKSFLYVLDFPTTGLHNQDVSKLIKCLEGLVEQGHTVICIEHHKAILDIAHRVIELSPATTGPRPEMARRSHALSSIRHPETLSLKHATTHNLKGIDINIPHGKFTVITGVSGSGKSSLAFDTIYAEARNRFLGNFSAYVRSRIGMKEKPDFESVEGLRPSFAVEQSGLQMNPRSTVGTYTGIYDLYRLLYSRASSKAANDHRPKAAAQQPGPMAAAQQPGPMTAAQQPLSSAFSFNSIQGACPDCDGLGIVTLCDPEKLVDSPGLSILQGAMDGSRTGKFYGDPYGQYVSTLKAVGRKHQVDYSLPWKDLPAEAKEMALNGCGEEEYDVSWEYVRNKRSGTHHFRGRWVGLLALVNSEYSRKHGDQRGEEMLNVMQTMKCRTCLGSRLNPEALQWVIRSNTIAELSHLDVGEAIRFFSELMQDAESRMRAVGPIMDEILKRLRILEKLGLSYLSMDRSTGSVSRGEGRRLQLAAQTGSGLSGMIYVLDEPAAGLHPREIPKLMQQVNELLDGGNTVIAVEHDRNVIMKADYIIDMGPGAGIDGGNLVAEGSLDDILKSTASVTGKYLAGNGKKEKGNGENSYEARRTNYDLRNSHRASSIQHRVSSVQHPASTIRIRGAFANNLKNFDLEIPLGGIICVTGVSGAGKSSLVNDLLYASWLQQRPVGCKSIEGFERFGKVIAVEPREDFSSSVSVVATYSGLFDHLRKLFANTPEAKNAGFKQTHFSFLSKESQCPECTGSGTIRISMDFMPDIYSVCETCGGKRYKDEILAMRWKGRNIYDVLDLSITEALEFFLEPETGSLRRQGEALPGAEAKDGAKRQNQHPATSILHLLSDSGLGYLKLGQSLNTLSGGESQRLNLCKELLDDTSIFDQDSASCILHPASLYLFDEPTTGLHFADIEILLKLFKRLADAGNTLLVIEHDPQVIAQADHVIELGPLGGPQGGFLISG